MNYVMVMDKDQNVEKMEALVNFNIDESNYNYIIYKRLDSDDCFVAKYVGDNIVDLITDLSNEELAYAQAIYDSLNDGGE